MGAEKRNGRFYWYDRWRAGGRVRCEYVGPLSSEDADLIRQRAAVAKDRKETARTDAEAVAKRADEILAAGEKADHLAEGVFRAVMRLTGHALHNRGEWRRTRGVSPMATIQEAGAAPVANPKPAGPPSDAEVQALVEKAGRGAAPAVLAFRELLKNPAALETLGHPAAVARVTLVGMAAHGQPTVAAEVIAHCERQTAKLLAEGGPEPSFAEWMAAARVVNNWLTVHNLEALAATNRPEGAPVAALDKRLTQAERRLHAALKSLAVLRRLRKPAAVTQVNIAKGGPMVVNNTAPVGKP